MNKSISRAQFLRGDFSGKRHVIRPPWSGAEHWFMSHCTRCDACLQACPEKILTTDNKGLPSVDFSRGECTFCGECAQACQAGVFQDHTTTEPWTLKASIGNECLPLQGVVCSRCGEECEAGAINLRLVAGGISIPVFQTESCTGCGACSRVCPVSAIELSYHGASL